MPTKITKLDKPTVRHIAHRLQEAVKPLAQEWGVVIDVGRCTFGPNNCRLQLNVALLDADNKAISEDAECFKHNAKLFGFEPADLGREFVSQGKSFSLCGLRPQSRKYPVLATSADGRTFKFPCRTVLMALGREVPDWL